jgi:hypothetical protein
MPRVTHEAIVQPEAILGPDTLEVVSYSELDTLRQCPLKWFLAYNQRWKKEGTAAALARGTAWHSIMETHYGWIRSWQLKSGGTDDHPKRLAAAAQKRALADARTSVDVVIRDCGLDDAEKDLLIWMYDGYVEMHGADPDWWIVAVECKEEIPLPYPGRTPIFRIKVKVDLVVRDLSLAGHPYKAVDHKSAANLPSDKELDIDDQFGLYQFAITEIGQWPLIGTIYNGARTTRNLGDKPGADVKKNKPQPIEKRHLRYRMSRGVAELRSLAIDANKAAIASRRLLADDPGEEPYSAPNPDTCKWKCDFLEQHLAARKIGVPVADVLSRGGFIQDYTRH